MSFCIEYGSFSGPMEVLIELIRNREMNIYDIQIHILVDDFMAYIDGMDGLDMESVADFLAMASYLLAIKSRMLLPKRVAPNEAEEEEEDPRKELAERIVEYQKVKAQAEVLGRMAEAESGAIYRKQADFSRFDSKNLLKDESSDKLMVAYREVMRRFRVHERAQNALEKIPAAEYSFRQARHKIAEAFRKWQEPRFFDMVEDAQSRIEVVTIFLTMLELIKNQKIVCTQAGRDIILTRKETEHAS